MTTEVEQYRAYLHRHYWRRVVPAQIGSGAVIGFCTTDLWTFTTSGNSVLPPLLALFIDLCAVGLAIVASVASSSVLGMLDKLQEPQP
jgi:hypothetical protein